jgi:rhamnosyltransferase
MLDSRKPEKRQPGVSVVIPTLNGQPYFERLLAALKNQSFNGPVEIVVVDSGSTDGTLKTAADGGAAIFSVEKDSFNHGDTRNFGIYNTRAPCVVLLSQDAEPVGDRWLETMVRPLREDERVAGVSSRIVPRPETDPVTRAWIENDPAFGEQREIDDEMWR